LSGLTISNGTGSAGPLYYENLGYGGGIANYGTLTLSGCTLSGNQGTSGGAIYNADTMTVSGCTLSGNRANEGAGIFNDGVLTVSGCTVVNNSFFGIYNNTLDAALVLVNDSVISGGIAGGYTDGGGNQFI
jgi:hypothetical protein